MAEKLGCLFSKPCYLLLSFQLSNLAYSSLYNLLDLVIIMHMIIIFLTHHCLTWSMWVDSQWWFDYSNLRVQPTLLLASFSEALPPPLNFFCGKPLNGTIQEPFLLTHGGQNYENHWSPNVGHCIAQTTTEEDCKPAVFLINEWKTMMWVVGHKRMHIPECCLSRICDQGLYGRPRRNLGLAHSAHK